MQSYGSGATKLQDERSFGHIEAPPCDAPHADLSELPPPDHVSHSEHRSKAAKPGGEQKHGPCNTAGNPSSQTTPCFHLWGGK